ncbi:dockerin type I repeat-containing protein [Sodaliphilus sp.]|uniref:dockerin type I repeat-containing protein n=1 Tax=Sodaliphilus sp. TaxID=2815818 RepID=UPI003890E0D2
MKKFVLLGLAATLGLAANAGSHKSNAQVRNFEKATNVAKVEAKANKHLSADVANFKYAGEFGSFASRARKVAVKADGDVEYVRPDGSWWWSGDEDGHGYHGLLLPAFAKTTWRNVSANPAAAYEWYTFAEYDQNEGALFELASEDFDFEENTGYSIYKNFFMGSTGLSYFPALSSYAPLLAQGEDEFEYQGLVQYGGVPQIVADTTTAELNVYPVAQYDGFEPSIANGGNNYYFNMAYAYFATPSWQYGANDPNALWLARVQKNYPTASNAKVEAICQELEKPAAPYILNAIKWNLGVNTDVEIPLTLKVRKINEDGTLGDYIAESEAVVPVSNPDDFGFEAVFPFYTEDELGGMLDGITIEDALFLELSGWQDAYENNQLKIFTTPSVAGLESYVDKYNHFGSYAAVSFDMDGESYISYQGAAFGYYLDDSYTTVGYNYTFQVDAEVEMPWLVVAAESNEFKMDAAGGEENFLVGSYKSGDEWDIWTVDGEELPEWITFETTDRMTCQGHAYDYVTNVKLTAEALPAGVDYRECQIKFGFRDAWSEVITVSQGEKQEGLKGDVNGDGEVDVKDSAILINVVLGLDDAAKYAGRCDVDGNGEVDAADINALINIILGTAK